MDVALLPDGAAVASWIEFANQRSSFAMRRVEASGRLSPVVSVAAIEGARASGYPRVAFDRDELVFAWTENDQGRSSVRTAVARVLSPSTVAPQER